jgi:hypothetical protein
MCEAPVTRQASVMTSFTTTDLTLSTTALAAQGNGWTWAGAAAVAVLALGFLFFFLAALISILRSELTGGMKLVWVVFAFCAPFLGCLLWFAVGRKDSGRRLAR